MPIPIPALAIPAASAAMEAAGGIFNAIQQSKDLKYRKELQQQIFDREDNAQVRSVQDMRNAGLSPTLAAGAGANAGAAVSTNPVQIETEKLNLVKLTQDIMQQKKDMSRTDAETANLNLQHEQGKYSLDVQKKIDPEKLRKVQLQNTFDTQMNPQRLNAMAKELTGKDLSNVNKDLDNQLKAKHINQAQLNIVAAKLSNTLRELNISKAKQDILIKQATLKLQNQTHTIKQYDYDWYKSLNYPTNIGFDQFTRPMHMMTGNMESLFDLNQTQQLADSPLYFPSNMYKK